MAPQNLIEEFLAGESFAVVGASRDRRKYGNKVLHAFLQWGRLAYPINPHADLVEGLQAYPDLESLPEMPHGVSVITPPEVTQQVLQDAAALGLTRIWLQPGAENPQVLALADRLGLNLIHSGPCVLVVLGYRE